MSEDREALIEAEKEIQRLKVALTNAAAIEKSYLKFGPIFDELFKKIEVVEKRVSQLDAKIANHQNLIVKALQERYRGGTT